MTLRVGHITYANCAPFFHYLDRTGFDGEIVPGVPATLNALLAAGEIDVSPSSSFEYLRNWRHYLLLPGQSISSFGPVRSVLLFSVRPVEELDGGAIALTGESATSVNLLKILFREFYGHNRSVFRGSDRRLEDGPDGADGALLIGDRALRLARRPAGWRYCYDLGELWVRFTGLPFVFALWILRREAVEEHPAEVAALLEQLSAARRQAFASLEAMAADSPERSWLPEPDLAAYWRCMDYDLGPAHLAGLRRYSELCVKHGLLDEMPEFRFFTPESQASPGEFQESRTTGNR